MAGPHGCSGASLVEVLVATLLVAIGVSISWQAFDGSVRRLDEAHLGLHAAILFTEASRAGEPDSISRLVGPGRMELVSDVGSIGVRYVPPNGRTDARSPVYARAHVWTFAR